MKPYTHQVPPGGGSLSTSYKGQHHAKILPRKVTQIQQIPPKKVNEVCLILAISPVLEVNFLKFHNFLKSVL